MGRQHVSLTALPQYGSHRCVRLLIAPLVHHDEDDIVISVAFHSATRDLQPRHDHHNDESLPHTQVHREHLDAEHVGHCLRYIAQVKTQHTPALDSTDQLTEHVIVPPML